MSISSALIPAGGLGLMDSIIRQTLILPDIIRSPDMLMLVLLMTLSYLEKRQYQALRELLLHLAQLLQHIGDRLYYQYMQTQNIALGYQEQYGKRRGKYPVQRFHTGANGATPLLQLEFPNPVAALFHLQLLPLNL